MSLEAALAEHSSLLAQNLKVYENLCSSVNRLSTMFEKMLAGVGQLQKPSSTERQAVEEARELLEDLKPARQVRKVEPEPDDEEEETPEIETRREHEESRYAKSARGVPAEDTRDEPKKRTRRTKAQMEADRAAERVQEEPRRRPRDEDELPLEEPRGRVKPEIRDEFEDETPRKSAAKTILPAEFTEAELRLRCRAFVQGKLPADKKEAGMNQIRRDLGVVKILDARPDQYAKIVWALDRFEKGEPVNFKDYNEIYGISDEDDDGEDI